MTVDDSRAEQVVLPPVTLDPVFVDAVDEALAGPQESTSPYDPDRVLGADPHDFAGLYIRHRSSFSLHARRFLRDQRDVDEVVQEAFLRLFLVLPELSNELQALSYCRRTVTNLCIDRYRADQRRPRLVDLESIPADVLGDGEADDPVIQAEDAAIVREALALLTPLHREALVKREIEEKTLPVIAAELGIPEDSVKHLLHRARRALRRHLAATHLAPGADLDDTSTLSLLARSAVSGTGRVGVLVVLLAGLLAGVSTTKVPAQALGSIASFLSLDPPPKHVEPQRAPAATGAPAPLARPEELPAAGRVHDDPGPIVALPRTLLELPKAPTVAARATAGPLAAVVPGAATNTVTTAPGPSAGPTAAPTGEPGLLPDLPVGTRPGPTAEARPSPGAATDPDSRGSAAVVGSAPDGGSASASPAPSGDPHAAQ